MVFANREEAGRRLAERVAAEVWTTPLVIGLPRGGIVVAAPIASRLQAPLEVLVARKVGLPGHEELGCGAVVEGLDEVVVGAAGQELGLGATELGRMAGLARRELQRQVHLYRSGRPLREVEGCDVLVVDDGLATGVTAEAALASLRRRRPARLVLVVPVSAPEALRRLGEVADEVICEEVSGEFGSVGEFYLDFAPVTDAAVLALLQPPV